MCLDQNSATKQFDSSNFTFKTFSHHSDSYNEDRVFELRFQVYCLERFFLPSENYPNQLEKDEYDDYSTYVSATNQSDFMVGALRMVKPPEDMPFPFQKHCTRLFNRDSLPLPHDCVEVSRVVISKSYRRRADDTFYGISSCQSLIDASPDQANITPNHNLHGRKPPPEILLGILRQAYQYSKKIGVSYWYVATEPALVRLLKRINFAFEAIGEEVDYYGPVTPYILAIDKFEADLTRNNPAMFNWFKVIEC